MTENLTTTTDRPAVRRRTRRALAAVAISGALLVPTAAVTIAAPFHANGNAAAQAQGAGQAKGKAQEQSFTECVESVNPSGNGELTPAVIMKGARCVAAVGDISPEALTVEKATDLVSGGLAAVETAGFDRSEIPGLLDRVSESEVLQRFVGEDKLAIVELAADSEILALYAAGEIDRDEAAALIAEAYVTRGADAGE
ncbi:hypothetical protein E7744_04635 [Citricoccus sp. SGAir0253]|uniref:hypothetical protein n=1 Tax=Citricoccus sp. SGAir0253 TaxID=2567881 RepID=UPI0010CCE621|nr:hypothetical protein [Citricoccus sp. SGAir0253]QCU77584.1 hypothetical protein E7744_04635 [Citricoccus sp. SGAir0253]